MVSQGYQSVPIVMSGWLRCLDHSKWQHDSTCLCRSPCLEVPSSKECSSILGHGLVLGACSQSECQGTFDWTCQGGTAAKSDFWLLCIYKLPISAAFNLPCILHHLFNLDYLTVASTELLILVAQSRCMVIWFTHT